MNNIIKFSHDEVEALLQLINDVENDKIAKDEKSLLTESEASAKEKLKKIYARQILSHEKELSRQRSQ